MTHIIPTVQDISDTWLSKVLGVPTHVLERIGNDAFNSSIVHLRVQSDSREIPERLLVKLNANGDGEFEIRFYQLANAQSAPSPSLPRCLACAYDTANGTSYLVLEDLSATHKTPVIRTDVLAGQGMPSDTHLQQMIEALARFHAYWWEHPALKSGAIPVRPWYGNEGEFRAHLQRREREWAAFSAKVKDFPDDWNDLYNELLVRLPLPWSRYLEARIVPFRCLTMSNGDCYFAQFLCPIEDSMSGTAYIVDFQEASGNFCTFDLIFMFATFWTPEQRHENDREMRLLRRYHKILHEQGISNYPWDNLLQDYRLMLALIVFFPIFDAVSGAPRDYWWPKMQCLVANFRDLDCMALFG